MGVGIVDYVRICTDVGGNTWHHPKYYIHCIRMEVPALYKTFYGVNKYGRRYAQGLIEVQKCISRPLLPIEARENRTIIFS